MYISQLKLFSISSSVCATILNKQIDHRGPALRGHFLAKNENKSHHILIGHTKRLAMGFCKALLFWFEPILFSCSQMHEMIIVTF